MKYEFRGKTIKDAITKGLKKMGLKEKDVQITILDEGTRGLFALDGKQQAVVMIKPKSMPEKTMKPNYAKLQKQIKTHLGEILRLMEVNVSKINTSVLTGRIYANVICDMLEVDEELIFAVENIINEILNRRNNNTNIKIHLDCNFKIRKLEEELSEKAVDIAKTVKETGRPYRFERPMRFYRRKIIHDAVKKVPGVTSKAHGDGDEKIVEVFLKKEGPSSHIK